MANFYIQCDTLAQALAAASANTRSNNHYISTSYIGMGRSFIAYNSSTGHTFYFAKQLTYSGTPPVANGYVSTAYFDDVPVEKLSGLEYLNILKDKEFLFTGPSNQLVSNAYISNAVDFSKIQPSYIDEYPFLSESGLGGSYAGFNGDSEYPYCYRGALRVTYYGKFFVEAELKNVVKFISHDFHYLVTGQQGFYSFNLQYFGQNNSVSGALKFFVPGPAGADGADGAPGIDGVDGVDGLDAPVPDLTGIETALANLTNLTKLQKYDDMLLKFAKFDNFEKIVNSICALMSNDARLPENLIFTGEYKNSDNLMTKFLNNGIEDKLSAIVKTLCKFLSWSANNPDELTFITLGEVQKNAENIRDLIAVLNNDFESTETEYPALNGAIAELMPVLSKLITKTVAKVDEL